MLTLAGVAFAALLWLGLLFAVALFGERRAAPGGRWAAVVYALSLAIYCTSWTFYGTVTQGVRSGWWLPPTFVGTILLYVLALPLLERLVEVAKSVNATSVADFIASRFGKSSGLAALVTLVALVGMVPYIALQLKAVAMSFSALVASGREASAWQDSALWVALVMALFAMLFGTRRTAADEGNRGLMLAMAFEAVFKLVAMLAVGVFVAFVLYASPLALAEAVQAAEPAAGASPAPQPMAYFTLAALGALAMVTLPHQFHVGVVECRERGQLRTARWLFPLFLLLISLPVWPLAQAGTLQLAALGLPSDLYVLGLPLLHEQHALTLFAFLGGLSAATGMVILASLSLSIMLGNHWLTPLLLRRGWSREAGLAPLRGWLGEVRWQRRLGIALVLGLGYGYSRALAGLDALADIGAQSFSALAQLAPAVLLGLYRPRLPARAIGAGLVAGFVLWGYVLIAPILFGEVDWIARGPFGVHWLAPASLLGLDGLDPLSRAVWVSLAVNLSMLALVARLAPERAVGAASAPLPRDALREVAARFLSADRLDRVFAAPQAAPAALEDRVGHELTAVLGAASTRLLLDAARRGSARQLDEVASIVGEAAQAARFSQQVLEAALENMSQGISVVDADLRLVAWNRRYAERFGFPPELLEVGRPVADLARHAVATVLGPGVDVDAEIARRLDHMRAGTPHLSERRFPDGTIIEIRGNPMPGGGFVATFTDVTAFRRTEAELKGIAETLEQRVGERTAELALASAAAERANREKTRFLAAVSHDLAQPLNAAHLFTHALLQQAEGPLRTTATQIEGALGAAEDLLAGLLDMSRLDAGGLAPQIAAFPLERVLAPLAAEFGVLAAGKGLALRAAATRCWVRSDPQLLRRVLQNFLANAVRYTERGGVLIGVRRRAGGLRIEVWDSGPGIAEADRRAIFEEFRRLGRGGQGLGLGLAIADRIARLLGHPLALRSWPGRGSCFSIALPRAAASATPPVASPHASEGSPRMDVLVVDNDASVRAAMEALLGGWQCAVRAVAGPVEALAEVRRKCPDLLLLDYHLDDGATGTALLREIRAAAGEVPAALITADHSEAVRREVEAAGAWLLHKPLKPLALKSLMARIAG